MGITRSHAFQQQAGTHPVMHKRGHDMRAGGARTRGGVPSHSSVGNDGIGGKSGFQRMGAPAPSSHG